MWIVCITSVRHVLTVNGYGGRQTKENEKSWCFKGWETLVILGDYKVTLIFVMMKVISFFIDFLSRACPIYRKNNFIRIKLWIIFITFVQNIVFV